MKLSVIIPYYNADRFIGRMLDSLLKQDLAAKEYEIIVVDDGSKEEPVVLKEYEERYGQVKYFRQENAGPGAARNSGIEHAKGEYIFFCDSDDYVAENVLGTLFDIAHGRNLDMLFFNVPRVNVDEKLVNQRRNFSSIKEYSTGQEYFAQPINKFISMGVWQFIISRSFISKYNLRFPSDMIMNEDACFYIDSVLLAKHTAKVDVDAYFYVQNPQSSIHFSGKVLQSEKWTNNILIFINKLNNIVNDKMLTKDMPRGCFDNLIWLKNNKSMIVLKEGCRYLPTGQFEIVVKKLVNLNSYPKLSCNHPLKMRILFNKIVIRLINCLFGIKRYKIKNTK